MTQLKVGFTVNWEGRSLDGVEPLQRLRERFPHIPITHFVSAAYFARGGDFQRIIDAMVPAFTAHDEFGLLLNTWESIHGSGTVPDAAPTVIEGEDPVLEVRYPGIHPQVDRGYTRALSAFEDHQIDTWLQSSRVLLSGLIKQLVQRQGLSVDAVLRGFRAGHSMASDAVLELARARQFRYDASAFDASWAWRRRSVETKSAFGSWPGMLADLWGPEAQEARHLANARCLNATAGTGVDWRSQPFLILADGEGELLEMPINGGLIPPVSPLHLEKIGRALAMLPSASGSYLSFGIHQDTADGEIIRMIEETVAKIERAYEVEWATLASIADGLSAAKQADAFPLRGRLPRAPRVRY